MWLARAIFPIGAGVNIFVILSTNYWIGASDTPPFDMVSFPTLAIYVMCLLIPVKEALGLAVLSAFLSSGYFLLTRFLPEYDFTYSGYAYAALTVIPLAIYGNAVEGRAKAAVRAYFLCRQIGSLSDVAKATALPEAKVRQHVEAFVASGDLEIMLDKPVLYRWTEERTYSEGMRTVELTVEV
ncbi:hypothetical protein [Massilia sp.]|uniref:hypothetical protein n=1 Tax=Massilia sp. TaxID=1882437 RepID=UPI00289878F1|nr:hypothetical protein [Massilia sp.]